MAAWPTRWKTGSDSLNSSGRRFPGGDWTPTILTVICGLAVSFGGFAVTRQYHRNTEEQAFAAEAARQADVLKEGIKRYTDAVGGVATFVTASDRIDRWEFLRFANLTLSRYSGFSALAWVPRVPQQGRGAFETDIQRDGLFGLTIRETSSDGALTSAAERREYLPIAYLVPFEGNEDALSYDLGSDPRYRRALDLAGDYGRVLATGPLPLPRIGPNGTTVWLISPLYTRNSATSDILERRRALTGFVVGVLRIDAFMKDALGTADSAGVHVAIFDATDGAPANALSEPVGTAPSVDGQVHSLAINKALDVAGRRWSLVATASPEHPWQAADLLPWGVALVGALLTGLLAQHLVNSVLQRRTIERVVRQRTAQLSDRNAELQTEVAQRERKESELRAAKDQAESASRAKSEFLAAVSHELRTPLNAIIGFSALLSGESAPKLNPEKSRGYAADIHSSGTHLLALINDIIDLSKAEAGQIDVSDALVDLQDVISSSLAIVEARAEAAGVALMSNVPADLPSLDTDERKLKQILLNLLSNAIKFTPDGGTVSVAAALDDDGDLTITVADTGIGIAAADIERVFEPFVQLDSSLARKYEGTGLGLSLSRRWAQLLGGSLVLKSELGSGTTAEIRLPKERIRALQPGGDEIDTARDESGQRPYAA